MQSRVDVNFLALPGAVKDVLHQDRVKVRVKGHFYTSGHYGDKRLGFDADAEVNLHDRSRAPCRRGRGGAPRRGPSPCAGGRAADEGWVSLFDGKTLAGWKAAPRTRLVVPRRGRHDRLRRPALAPLLHGPGRRGRLRELRAQVEVLTKPGANSGVYFHTAYQEKDWPAQGFEVQVDNSQQRHGDYLELKMTGSLYGIRNVYKADREGRRVVHA